MDAGHVSASRSNGTLNPPIPTPTPKRMTMSCARLPAKDDAMPNAETKATPEANAGSRPYLSAKRPNRAHPTTSPPNTAAAMVSSQNSSTCQSRVASTEMNDRRFTSTESAATHRPTKRNRRHWYQDHPIASLSSSSCSARRRRRASPPATSPARAFESPFFSGAGCYLLSYESAHFQDRLMTRDSGVRY